MDMAPKNAVSSAFGVGGTCGAIGGTEEAMRLVIAGELDGGLTRANLMVAARSMEMTHPMYLDGIKFNLNGRAIERIIRQPDAELVQPVGQGSLF